MERRVRGPVGPGPPTPFLHALHRWAVSLFVSLLTKLVRPCLDTPKKTQNFIRFSITSNLVAHALNIKYRQKITNCIVYL